MNLNPAQISHCVLHQKHLMRKIKSLPRFQLSRIRLFWIFFFVASALHAPCDADEFIQLPGIIHVHSTFSSGHYSLEELVEKAKQTGIEVLILTDHDWVVMEYGLFPFRNLIKKREERNSVLIMGPENYLSAISTLNQNQKDVMVIPGVQSSPFYYWTGSPFKGTLTAHEYRKELLVIGMKHPKDYENLPVLHRGFSTRYLNLFLPRGIVLFCAFLLSIYLFFQKGLLKGIGVFTGLFSLMLLINHLPFQGSRFDPYHGDRGILPFQELIDYVRKHKGLVFWAHPESQYTKAGIPMGSVLMTTQPYPDALLEAKNYTGFSAIYGDESTAAEPGKQWDQVLNNFCRDKRKRPPWAISGSDFHVEQSSVELDTFQTIFLVRQKTIAAVLESLAKGRVYTVQKSNGIRLILDRFEIGSKDADKFAFMGSGIKLSGTPIVRINIASSDGAAHAVDVSLIRGGKQVKSFTGVTPLEILFEDHTPWSGKTFYRLDAKGETVGRLISNPIFAMKDLNADKREPNETAQ